MWKSATNLSLLLNFPFILMSNIMCTFTYSYPDLVFPFLVSLGVTLSSFLNTIWTFVIYFVTDLVQKSVPNCLSISYTYFTVLGTCITNLCDVRQYLNFTLEINLYRLAQSLINPQDEVRFILYLTFYSIFIQFN